MYMLSILGNIALKGCLRIKICDCDVRKEAMKNDDSAVAGGHHSAYNLPVFQTVKHTSRNSVL